MYIACTQICAHSKDAVWIGYIDSSHFWYCRQRKNSGGAHQKKKIIIIIIIIIAGGESHEALFESLNRLCGGNVVLQIVPFPGGSREEAVFVSICCKRVGLTVGGRVGGRV